MSFGRSSFVWVAAFTMAGFALRLWFIEVKPFWYDEAFTYVMVSNTSLRELLVHLYTGDSHPPLYYLLQRGNISMWGASEFVLRFPSLLAGTLAIPIASQLGDPDAPAFPRLLTVAMVAFLPALVHFSIEARSYEFVLVLALLAQIVYRAYLRRRDTTTLVTLMVLCLILLYTHRATVVLVAAVQLHYHFVGRRSEGASSWDAASWLLVAGCFPWLVGAFNQMERWPWIAGVASYLQFDTLILRYSPMMAVPSAPVRWIGFCVVTAMILGALASWFLRRRSEQPHKEREQVRRPPWKRWAWPVSAIALGVGGLLLFHAEPRSSDLPLLANRYIGRALVVVGATWLALLATPWLAKRWAPRFLRALSPEVGIIVFSLLVASVMTSVRETIGYKQLIFLVPGVYLVCMSEICRGSPRLGRALGVLLVAMCAVSVPFQGTYNLRSDWRAAARLLSERFEPGDRVLVYPKHQRKVLSFYFDEVKRNDMDGLFKTVRSQMEYPSGTPLWWVGETDKLGSEYLSRARELADELETHEVPGVVVVKFRWR